MKKQKCTIKDICSMTITDAKQVVKILKDKRLQTLRTKLGRFSEIADNEQNARNKKIIEAELDAEVEESITEIENELETDNEVLTEEVSA